MKRINFKKAALVSVFLLGFMGQEAHAVNGMCVVTLSDGTIRKAITDTKDSCDELLKRLKKYYHDNGATNNWYPRVNGQFPTGDESEF